MPFKAILYFKWGNVRLKDYKKDLGYISKPQGAINRNIKPCLESALRGCPDVAIYQNAIY